MEKGADWFLQNFKEIERSRIENEWYRRNTEIFKEGQKIKLSEFLRRVAELGYSKVWEVGNRGEFSQRGGVVRIFPINANEIIAVEFDGNVIAEITPLTPLTLRGENNEVIYKNPDKFGPLKVRGRAPGAGGYEIGDFVVHIDHGIGIFRGERGEDFVIEYASPKIAGKIAEPDMLFVPKAQIKRLSKG